MRLRAVHTRLPAVLTVAVIAATAAAPASAAKRPPNPYGPAYKYCGSFKAPDRIWVYATHMGCRKAKRIQREFWLGSDTNRTEGNGGSGASGYVLLKKYPGWRCGSGSGGGQCNKRKASAAYQTNGGS